MRFVNRFELPGPFIDLKDYFRILPEIASDISRMRLNDFFLQIRIPQEDYTLIVSEALAPPSSPETVSVILDFDLFREQTWKSDSEEIWDHLEKLGSLKNVVFEASITDKTKELIA